MKTQRKAGRKAAALIVAGAAVLAPAGTAGAHPAIDEAHAHYEAAAFTEALEALVRAEQSTDLTEGELHELLALRATIHFATRSDDAFRNSLRTLASIAPDHRFDADLPPPFLEAWQQARDAAEPLEVHVAVLEVGGGLRFHASVEGSADALVRSTPALYVREPGGEWQSGRSGVLVLRDASADAVELYAEATGPGGVVVARHGTMGQPRVVRLVALELRAPAPQPAPADPLPWIVAGAATAVAVALAITLGIVLANDTDSATTIVHAPAF